MAGEREDAINDLTGTDSASTTTTTTDSAAHVADDRENGNNNEADTNGGDGKAKPDEAKPNAEPAGALASTTAAAFLDSLTEPDPNGPAARGKDGKFLPKAAEAAKPADGAQPADNAAGKPVTAAAKPGELVADALIKEMGIKSERSQNRVREIVARSNELETKAQQFESDINEFRTMVQTTGMAPQEFVDMLEVGRLIKSDSEADKRLALEALDRQRDTLAKELGIELPGVDALSDFPDLQKKVENLEISKETALELAKYKRQERAQQQRQQVQVRSQQEDQAWNTKIGDVTKTAQAYFATRATEADAPAKFARVKAYFADPKNVQELVTTFTPEQWFGQIKFLYDNLRPAEATPRPDEQPARARPALSGKPATGAIVDNTARLGQHLDNMGI